MSGQHKILKKLNLDIEVFWGAALPPPAATDIIEATGFIYFILL